MFRIRIGLITGTDPYLDPAFEVEFLFKNVIKHPDVGTEAFFKSWDEVYL